MENENLKTENETMAENAERIPKTAKPTGTPRKKRTGKKTVGVQTVKPGEQSVAHGSENTVDAALSVAGFPSENNETAAANVTLDAAVPKTQKKPRKKRAAPKNAQTEAFKATEPNPEILPNVDISLEDENTNAPGVEPKQVFERVRQAVELHKDEILEKIAPAEEIEPSEEPSQEPKTGKQEETALENVVEVVFQAAVKKGSTKRRSQTNWCSELTEIFVTAVVFIFVIICFFFRVISVNGHSMDSTLKDGQRVVLTSFFTHYERGDIVVSAKPNSREKRLIKRVIATEGDKVNIKDGAVYIDKGDGKGYEKISEPYVDAGNLTNYIPSLSLVFPVTIPKGSVFLLGDNRTNSFDSRYSEVGLVEVQWLVGKVILY
jgi:signal peptidase I